MQISVLFSHPFNPIGRIAFHSKIAVEFNDLINLIRFEDRFLIFMKQNSHFLIASNSSHGKNSFIHHIKKSKSNKILQSDSFVALIEFSILLNDS